MNETVFDNAKRTMADFLRRAMVISLRASEAEIDFGHPFKPVMERTFEVGIKAFVDTIFEKQGYQGELRLNGAGLKLYWHLNASNELVLHVGGDQEAYYPKTAPALKELIRWMEWDLE